LDGASNQKAVLVELPFFVRMESRNPQTCRRCEVNSVIWLEAPTLRQRLPHEVPRCLSDQLVKLSETDG
jgi:hypothetical protein